MKKAETIKRRNACKKKAYELAKGFVHIFGDGREAAAVTQRRIVARQLHELGYSYCDIGFALNRDHTTIANMLDAGLRAKKHEIYLRKKEKTP